MANIKAEGYDGIFAPVSIETAPLIINQARENGVDCQIMAGDTWDDISIAERAGENAAQEADRERSAGLDNHRGDDAGQADDRTDGNINTGRDQHVCDADGQNAVDRCLVEHENQVRRRQERRTQDADHE